MWSCQTSYAVCPSYYIMTAKGCISTYDGSKLPTTGICPAGYDLNGDMCVKVGDKDRTDSFFASRVFYGKSCMGGVKSVGTFCLSYLPRQ